MKWNFLYQITAALYLFGAMHADKCTQRGKGSSQHWSFALIWYRRWWLPATDFHRGWNVGPPFWTWIQVAFGGTVPHNIPKKEKNLRMHCQQEKLWLQSIGMRNVLLFWISCLGGGSSELLLVCGNAEISEGPLSSRSSDKCQKCCCSIMMMPGHTQVCTPLRQSQNLDRQCYYTHCAVLTSYHYISTSLILLTFINRTGCLWPFKCKFSQTRG